MANGIVPSAIISLDPSLCKTDKKEDIKLISNTATANACSSYDHIVYVVSYFCMKRCRNHANQYKQIMHTCDLSDNNLSELPNYNNQLAFKQYSIGKCQELSLALIRTLDN